jgi:hypothetical protein
MTSSAIVGDRLVFTVGGAFIPPSKEGVQDIQTVKSSYALFLNENSGHHFENRSHRPQVRFESDLLGEGQGRLRAIRLNIETRVPNVPDDYSD